MCKKDLPLEVFNKNSKKKDGLQSQCRECWKIYYRENYYLRGNEKARLEAKRQKENAEKRVYIIQAKDRPCMDCGIKYPSYVMDFDHVDGDDKLFSIGAGLTSQSLKKIIEEIAKCEVVCSNCHRIRTHERRMALV